MKSYWILALSFYATQLCAHGLTDWRTDSHAFASYGGLVPRKMATMTNDDGTRNRFLIDPEFLRTKLSEFSGAADLDLDGRTLRIQERGSLEGRELARRYLRREYERLGFVVSEQSYSVKGTNLIAEKVGTDPSKVLIVSSHYDSVRNAGADDNGSGTISALALAQALSGSSHYTLRIVAFDEEERGLLGSRAYVAQLAQSQNLDRVIADIDVEMNGYNERKDGAFHVIDCDRADSKYISALVMEGVDKMNLPLQRSEACTDRSDHDAFWQKNKAAVVLSENFFGGDSNPCYHAACDKVDILDFNYMANVTRAVTWAAASIVEML